MPEKRGKKCPYCKEVIPFAALLCLFCERKLYNIDLKAMGELQREKEERQKKRKSEEED